MSCVIKWCGLYRDIYRIIAAIVIFATLVWSTPRDSFSEEDEFLSLLDSFLVRQYADDQQLDYDSISDLCNNTNSCRQRAASLEATKAVGRLDGYLRSIEGTLILTRNKVREIEEFTKQMSSNGCPPVTRQCSNLPTLPEDCSGYLIRSGKANRESGVYTISPWFLDRPISVYCDMDTDGGGWTVFQRRADFEPQQDFFLGWQEYKTGFGNLNKEFWLGNDNLFALTNEKRMELRIDMEDFEGVKQHVTYDSFLVRSETDLYTAILGNFNGTIADSFSAHVNGSSFSTKDRDHDKDPNLSCAQLYKGGWWYGSCYGANLNGIYRKDQRDDEDDSHQDGVNWASFSGIHDLLRYTEMKIRPTNFGKPQ